MVIWVIGYLRIFLVLGAMQRWRSQPHWSMGWSLGLLDADACSCHNFFRLFPSSYSSYLAQLFELIGLAWLFGLLGTCEFFWCSAQCSAGGPSLTGAWGGH